MNMEHYRSSSGGGGRPGSYSDRGGGVAGGEEYAIRGRRDIERSRSAQEREAVEIFNSVKETYAAKIDELNELKRQVFLLSKSGDGYLLDHHQRSKLRILIESLLIDLNEEIFALSEELAVSFAAFDTRSQRGSLGAGNGVLQRAYDFEQRKNALMRKIRENIDENHSVKILRRHAKISTLTSTTSPPRQGGQLHHLRNHNMNTFGAGTIESEKDRMLMTTGGGAFEQTNVSTIHAQQLPQRRQMSTHSPNGCGGTIRRNYSSNKLGYTSTGNGGDDLIYYGAHDRRAIGGPSDQRRGSGQVRSRRNSNSANYRSSKTNSRKGSHHSLRKRKSPISLRIRDDSGKNQTTAVTAYQKMILDVYKQPAVSQRQTSRSHSRQNMRVASGSGMGPTYPGGNSSAKKQQKHNYTYDQRRILGENSFQNQQRGGGGGIGGNARKGGKRLEDFERYLAKKQQAAHPSRQINSRSGSFQTNQVISKSYQKENIKPDFNNINNISTIEVNQSAAFEAFTHDFALVKKTVLSLNQKVLHQQDRIAYLEEEVDGMRVENLKLVTDMKMMRNEHQEIMNSMFNMEQKSSTIAHENEVLRRMLGTQDRDRESKYNQVMRERTGSQNSSIMMGDDRKQSPIRSSSHQATVAAMHKDNRSTQSNIINHSGSMTQLGVNNNNSTHLMNYSSMKGTGGQELSSTEYKQGASLISKDFISFQPQQLVNSNQQQRESNQRLNRDIFVERGSSQQDGDLRRDSSMSREGYLKAPYHNPLLSVASGGERNNHQLVSNAAGAHTSQPPHLLQAHTLGNISKITTSRQRNEDHSPQTPDQTHLRQPITQKATNESNTPSQHRNDEQPGGGKGSQFSLMNKQRSLNALNTNMPAQHISANHPNAASGYQSKSHNLTPSYSGTNLQQQQPPFSANASNMMIHQHLGGSIPQMTSHSSQWNNTGGSSNKNATQTTSDQQLSNWVLERLNKGGGGNINK